MGRMFLFWTKHDKTIRRWSSCIVVGSGSLTYLDGALFLKMALGQGQTRWNQQEEHIGVIPFANFSYPQRNPA